MEIEINNIAPVANAGVVKAPPVAKAPSAAKATSSLFVPGFDTIRCLAVILVIFSHSLSYLKTLELGGLAHLDFLAKYGVTLFFGLSGFLITYLLIHEYEKTQTINAKFFIIRRVLRIWPLYFLMVAIAYGGMALLSRALSTGIFVSDNIIEDILLQLSFLWNFKIGDPEAVNKVASPFWSIHVEEQFYLLYPFLFKFLITRYRRQAPAILAGIVGLIWVGRLVFMLTSGQSDYYIEQAVYRWTFFRIDTMFLGAIAAFWVWQRPVKNMSRAGIYRLLFIALALFSAYFMAELYMNQAQLDLNSPVYFAFQNIKYPLQGIISVLVIVAIYYDRSNYTGFANRFTSAYGQVSYGIYLYHSLILMISAIVLTKLQTMGIFTLTSQPLYFILIVVAVYPLSWVSYHYFEKPFLKLKDRFTVVKSR